MPSKYARFSQSQDFRDEFDVPLLDEQDQSEYDDYQRLKIIREREFKTKRWCNIRHFPIFILIVSVVQIIVFIASIIKNGGIEQLQYNPLIGPSSITLKEMGARDVEAIIYQKQWWRFITPIFLHAGLLHLFLNLVFQIRVGAVLEQGIGSIRVGVIYMISGVAGNLASGIFLPHIISVGASGSLFGILGVLLVSNFKAWNVIERPWRSLIIMIITILLNLAIGLLPMVDNFCHIGGFLTGLMGGCVFLPIVKKTQYTEKWTMLQNQTVYFTRYGEWKNVVSLVLGVICYLVYFILGFYAFYHHIDGSEWCKWCSNLDCIQSWKYCRLEQEAA